MKRLLLISCLLLVGCKEEVVPTDPGVLPPAKIKVQTDETLDGVNLVITFDGNESSHPKAPERFRATSVLNLSEEELAEYRKQVEFLLGKIDEAQQKQEKRAKLTAEDYLEE